MLGINLGIRLGIRRNFMRNVAIMMGVAGVLLSLLVIGAGAPARAADLLFQGNCRNRDRDTR